MTLILFSIYYYYFLYQHFILSGPSQFLFFFPFFPISVFIFLIRQRRGFLWLALRLKESHVCPRSHVSIPYPPYNHHHHHRHHYLLLTPNQFKTENIHFVVRIILAYIVRSTFLPLCLTYPRTMPVCFVQINEVTQWLFNVVLYVEHDWVFSPGLDLPLFHIE